MPKSSVNAIITILRNAQRLNIDTDVLLDRAGISAETLQDPDNRIDSMISIRLMEEAEKLSNNPLFGLYHGSHFQPADMGLVGFLVLNAPTAKNALESYCHYQKIYGEGLRIDTHVSDDKIDITFVPNPEIENAIGPTIFYSHMSAFIATINWLLSRKLKPLKVNISEKKPNKLIHIDEFEKIYGNKITFSAKKYSLIYDEKDFNTNILTNNPELYLLFKHRAEKIIEQFGSQEKFQSIVATSLLKSLDSGKANLDTISSQLHKSKRTIQRLLKAEDTSFQEVLNGVREKSAKYYLETTSLNIDEITYLLGFSEASAFRKSFKKWTKNSPEQYRKSI